MYQGRGVFRICGEETAVNPYTLFIAKPDEPHEIISSRDDPLGIYFWSFTLSTTGSEKESELDANQDLNKLMQAFTQQSHWVGEKTDTILKTLQSLTNEIVAQQPGYIQKIKNLASTLLIDSARAVVPTDIPSVPLGESGNDDIQKIVRYLHDNYTRSIQVRDVAAQLHMSERHTSRIFRQSTGTSIQKYLMQLRLSIAQQRLIEQVQSVSEIAYSLGYKNAQHFSTIFHKHTGMTPSAFRKNSGTRLVE